MGYLFQVTEAYSRVFNSTPFYISSLLSPMRKRHRDEVFGGDQSEVTITILEDLS